MVNVPDALQVADDEVERRMTELPVAVQPVQRLVPELVSCVSPEGDPNVCAEAADATAATATTNATRLALASVLKTIRTPRGKPSDRGKKMLVHGALDLGPLTTPGRYVFYR